MQRWTSDPLPLAVDPEAGFRRIDLEFEAVEHDGPTFTALVYLNNPDVEEAAGRDPAANFAGGFSVFAHGECWGERGHCAPEREPTSPFDMRPEHPLTPGNVTLDVTDGVRALGEGVAELTVTVIAASTRDPDATADVLRFEQLTLVVYE